MPFPKANQDEMLRIAELAARGLSGSEIAAALGITRNAVLGWCHRAGIRLGRVDGGLTLPTAAPSPPTTAAIPTNTPQTPEEWSDALLAARTAAGVTQAEMSRMLGLGRGAYGHYESRGLLPRRMDVLDAIADRLGVDGRPLRRRLNYEQAVHAAAQQRRVAEMIAAGLPGSDGLTPRERAQRRADSALRASGGYGRHDLDTIAKRRAVLLMVRRVTGQEAAP